MANDLDKDIRLALKGIIATAYPTAIVYSWNALSHKLGDWPAMFRSSGGVVHGWVIKRAAAGSEWKVVGRDRKRWIYDIWGFYGFDTGKESDNSDTEFAEICDTVFEAIKDEPRLGLEEVDKHELLQFVNITTMNTGEETLHFAQGRMAVNLCC